MTHLARRPRPFSDLYKTTTLTALHTPSPRRLRKNCRLRYTLLHCTLAGFHSPGQYSGEEDGTKNRFSGGGGWIITSASLNR